MGQAWDKEGFYIQYWVHAWFMNGENDKWLHDECLKIQSLTVTGSDGQTAFDNTCGSQMQSNLIN